MSLLGFIVSGLAIIAGTVSNKVANQMDIEGKFDALISILFSYYFVGFVIGILIIIFFGVYFIFSLGLNFNIYLFLLLSIILTYGFFFVVLYSVSLLGTSLNIFVISYSYSKECGNITDSETDSYLLHYKIDALTALLIEKIGLTNKDFCCQLIKCISKDCPEGQRLKVLEAAKQYYSIKD